eukprot:3334980-Pyramimonas_sp.AAC.1
MPLYFVAATSRADHVTKIARNNPTREKLAYMLAHALALPAHAHLGGVARLCESRNAWWNLPRSRPWRGRREKTANTSAATERVLQEAEVEMAKPNLGPFSPVPPKSTEIY